MSQLRLETGRSKKGKNLLCQSSVKVYFIGRIWSNRKALLLNTIFAIHSPFLLESEKGKRITKVVIKSHAFLLDRGILYIL